jgi:hypothetical protein
MSHASAIRTEDEVARPAVSAVAARYSRRAQTHDPFTDLNVLDILANLNHCSSKFMSESYGREIAEGVMQHMNISATYTAKGDLYLDVAIATNGFGDISYADIAFT